MLKKFIPHTAGSIAPLAGLTLFIMLAASGAALDFTRTHNHKSHAQEVLDTAVLAAAVEYRNSANKKQAVAVANDMLKTNAVSRAKYEASIEIKNDTVTGTVTSSTTMTLMAVAGFDVTPWTVVSVAGVTPPPNTEYVVVADISASMKNGGHMDVLRNALLDFSDETLGKATRSNIAVSLVPFANGVSFPASYKRWLDPYNADPDKFVGCFLNEPTKIMASLSSKMIGYEVQAPDLVMGKQGKERIFCPRSDTQVSFFLTSKTQLDRNIKKLNSYQGTDTAEAISWANRMLSPDWRGIFKESSVYPRNYSSIDNKIMILFTDGLPFERPWEDRKMSAEEYQSTRDEALEEFKTVCESIKKENKLDVFVIAYGDDMTQDQRQSLRSCVARRGAYYEAKSLNLSAVFKAIARKSSMIALTR